MAEIIKTALLSAANVGGEVTETALSGNDTFVFTSGKKASILTIRNDSAFEVAIKTVGVPAGDPLKVSGGGVVDYSLGVTMTIPSGDTYHIDLNTIKNYLTGTIAVTGGNSDCYASIVEV